MIKLIFLVLLIGLVYAENQSKGVIFLKRVPEEDLKACADGVGVEVGEELEGLRKAIHSPEGRQKFPCFSKCVMQKMKVLNDDGDIDVKVVEAKVEEFKEIDENAKKSILECVDKVGKIGECDDVLKLVVCLPRGMRMMHEQE